MKKTNFLTRIVALVISMVMCLGLMPATAFAAGEGVDLVNSYFGGVNFVDAGSSNELVLPVSGLGTPVDGDIQVKFPVFASDKKIVLKTPYGTLLDEATGTGSTNGQATVSTTGTQLSLYNDYLYAKEITYNVNDNMIDYGVSDIVIAADHRIASQSLSGRLEVEVWWDGVLQDSAYIDTITIDNDPLPLTFTPFPSQYSAVNASVEFGTTSSNWFALLPNEYKEILFMDDVTIKVTPTLLTGNPLSDMTQGTFTNLDTANWTMTTNPLDGSATFTHGGNLANSLYETPKFSIYYPTADFNDGDKITYTVEFSATYWDGIPSTDPSMDLSRGGYADRDLLVTLLPSGVNYIANTSVEDANNNSIMGRDKTMNSKFGTDLGATGYLGQYLVGNKGGTDAGPSTVELNFDTTDIGVRAVTMVVPFVDGDPDGNNDNIYSNITYNVYNKTTNTVTGPFTYTGSTTKLDTTGVYYYVDSKNNLGLADDEYIASFSYEVPEIPLGTYWGYHTENSGAMFYGEIFNIGATATSTVEVYETAAPANTSGEWKCYTNTSDDFAAGVRYGGVADKTVNAGETATINVDIYAFHTQYGATTNPTLYIRNPSDATVDLSSIVVKDIYGHPLNAADMIISEFVDGTGANVVKIDTSPVNDGRMTISAEDCEIPAITGGLYDMPIADSNKIYLSWDYKTTPSTASGTYNIKDMIFVEDPATTSGPTDGGYSDTSDPFALSSGGIIYGLPLSVARTYKINGSTDMVADNAIKYTTEPSSEYKTYTGDGVFLIMDTNTIDIKTSIKNNSDDDITDSQIYIPIAKKGEAWGNGTENLLDDVNGSDPFAFSIELTQPTTNPDPSRFTILYGNLNATERAYSGGTAPMDTATYYTDSAVTTNTAVFPNGWASVNCVKIIVTGSGVAQGVTYDFVNEGIKLTYDASTEDSYVDIWAPVFFERYKNGASWYSKSPKGAYIAVRAQLGQIWGSLWLDENIDGVQDPLETNMPAADKAGWKVDIYEAGDYTLYGTSGTILDTVYTDTNGEYLFNLLDRTKSYTMVVTNPSVADYGFTAIGGGADAYLNNKYVGAGNQATAVLENVRAVRLVKDTGNGKENEAKAGIFPIGLNNAIRKTVDKSTATVGETFNYQVYYINGESTTQPIVIKDEIPTGTVLTAIPAGATGYSDLAMTTPTLVAADVKVLEWTMAAVASGASGSVTFAVNAVTSGTTANNKAKVTVGLNPEQETNQVSTPITAVGATNYKTVDKTNAYVGDAINYQVYYTNGETAPKTITITDAIPAGTELTAIPTGATGYLDLAMTTPTTVAADVKALKWVITAVPAGASGSVAFRVTAVTSGITASNTATIQITGKPAITTNTVQTQISSPGTTGGVTGTVGGTAILNKVDSVDSATMLAGAKFDLYRVSSSGADSKIGSYTTNSNGKITVSTLGKGDYYWVEVIAPQGYTLDDTKHEFSLNGAETKSITVENVRTDVPDAFGEDHYAYIVGYPDGNVLPQNNITRAEVATVFFRLLSDDVRNTYYTSSNNFSDVNGGLWFNKAVSTMANMGIVSGYSDGTFRPDAPITRAEFAAIAARFDSKGNTNGMSFSDIANHWAKNEIAVAVNNGWVSGYPDGTFKPDSHITRAEAMALVNRVLQRLPEDTSDLLSDMVKWPDNADTSVWYYLAVQEATNTHDYDRKANGYETWSEIGKVRNWAAIER